MRTVMMRTTHLFEFGISEYSKAIIFFFKAAVVRPVNGCWVVGDKTEQRGLDDNA